MVVIYIDGIFDMFHRGHLEALRKAKSLRKDVHLIVGIVCDKDAKEYKREPLFNQEDRYQIISALKCVDQVVFPAPLIVTQPFLSKYKIDIVTHAFANQDDYDKQKEFYEECSDIFEMIPYYSHSSTTNYIYKIQNNNSDNNDNDDDTNSN